MGEHAARAGTEGEPPLSPEEAEQAIARLEGFAEPLEARTGGITWMVWGVVTAGIFVTYEAAFPAVAGNPLAWVLWTPWVAAGVAVTRALWNSVALALDWPDDPADRRRQSMVMGLIILAFFVLAIVGQALRPPVPIATYWLTIFAVFTWGMTYATDDDPRYRALMGVGGLILLVGALASATVGLPHWLGIALAPAVWIVGGGTVAFRT